MGEAITLKLLKDLRKKTGNMPAGKKLGLKETN